MRIGFSITTIQKKRSLIEPDRSLLVAISRIDGSGKGYVTEKITTETNRQGLKAIARRAVAKPIALFQLRYM